MILLRYLLKEILSTLAAVTLLCLLIFLSTQLVRYLSLAAAGKIPAAFVLKLMMLEVPNLIGLLLPLGLFSGIMLAYGRLYADNEMTVLSASGMSQLRLTAITLVLAIAIAALVASLLLYVTPEVAKYRNVLLSRGQAATLIQTIMPGRFQSLSKGKQVFYVKSLDENRKAANGLFMARWQGGKKTAGDLFNDPSKPSGGSSGWQIVTAKRAEVIADSEHGGEYVVLRNGHRYQGTPGKKDYKISDFARYAIRVPPIQVSAHRVEKGLPTEQLWPVNNSNPRKAAEIQWRLSVPLMTIILAILAVPLSRVTPRQGKFGKMLPAIGLYVFYANMMFVVRNWLQSGEISANLGIWWLHGLMLLLAIGLYLWPGIYRRLSVKSLPREVTA